MKHGLRSLGIPELRTGPSRPHSPLCALERATFLTFKAGCSLATAALCGNRPHRFHSASSVDRVEPVQGHRRVAMAREQTYAVAQAQTTRAATPPSQRAVFVPGKV